MAMTSTPILTDTVTTPPPGRPSGAVHVTDRLWDAAAVLLAGGGVALFLVARAALQSLAAGTYEIPPDVSAIARAEFHVTQSRIALWLVAVGVIVGVVAAIRHRLRSRADGHLRR